MTAVNPSLQVRYGQHPASAFANNAPTLNVVDAAYGDDAAARWLMPQIYAVGEFAGVREKMDEWQVVELARTIRAHYGFLTVTELMYFFSQLNAGKYGKFFGSVDPMVITEAIKTQFLPERERWIEKAESQQREQERQQRAKEPTITFEEYMRRKQAGRQCN